MCEGWGGSCNQDSRALLFMGKHCIISPGLLCFLRFPNVCSGLFNFSLLHLSNEKVKCNKWITQGHYKECLDLFGAFNFRAKAWFSVTLTDSNCLVSLRRQYLFQRINAALASASHSRGLQDPSEPLHTYF